MAATANIDEKSWATLNQTAAAGLSCKGWDLAANCFKNRADCGGDIDSDDAPSLTNSRLAAGANRTYTYGGARRTAVAALTNITHRDPDILSGSLVFVGTRVPVRSLFDYLEGGESLDEFLHQFPSVKREFAIAVLDAAYETVAADANIA
jgi:uncharacterized protein (DUF433 family)